VQAQRSKKEEAKAGPPAAQTPAAAPNAPKKGAELIKEKLKPTRAYPGLLAMHQDTTNGMLYMVLKKGQLGKEFIYWSYIENGLPQLGLFKGNFWDNGVFSIERYFDRIDFVRQNTDFYFDPNSALSKAKGANINRAILATTKIVASDSASGEILVEANGVFLSEALTQIKPMPNPQAPPSFGLGAFQSGKSRVVSVRNYPTNSDVVLDYVYENPTPFAGARPRHPIHAAGRGSQARPCRRPPGRSASQRCRARRGTSPADERRRRARPPRKARSPSRPPNPHRRR